MSLLNVAELNTGYQKMEVLHNISLKVEEGSIVTVIGPNGAGKSTLMHAIAGTLPVKSGTIQFKNKQINDIPPHERVNMGMSYVPQDFNIFPDLTVLENLEMGGFTLTNLSQKIDEIFSYFPILKERSHQYANTLSGGESRMLAIGSALLTNPDLLILDEPISGLSPNATHSIIERIKLINQNGCALLWVVEENPREILATADYSYLIFNGTLSKEGNASDFLNDENFDKLFLGQNVE